MACHCGCRRPVTATVATQCSLGTLTARDADVQVHLDVKVGVTMDAQTEYPTATVDRLKSALSSALPTAADTQPPHQPTPMPSDDEVLADEEGTPGVTSDSSYHESVDASLPRSVPG